MAGTILPTPDNAEKPDPKWEQIEQAGQKYALEHLSNDNATEKLVDLMRRITGDA